MVQNEMWTRRMRQKSPTLHTSSCCTVHTDKTDSCMSQNNTHPYVDPQDGRKLVAMVNAWMSESVFDSGIFLSLVYMCREPAVGHVAIVVYL